eukprot:9450901-Pyramimonas_sp.AAC.1
MDSLANAMFMRSKIVVSLIGGRRLHVANQVAKLDKEAGKVYSDCDMCPQGVLTLMNFGWNGANALDFVCTDVG